ncbi:hypothetical protein JYT48_02015 [Mariprofundus ferrooxydans]|nr:hypothetical protein [Mariprofundus ferrooxydans]
MIRIDRLNLQLPSEYEGRAHAIVQLIAAELARYPVTQNVKREHMALQAIHIAQGSSDKHVAASIANQIHHRVGGSTGGSHG